jgi:hypothetical protein
MRATCNMREATDALKRIAHCCHVNGACYDRVLSDADVELLATIAWTRLHPAA